MTEGEEKSLENTASQKTEGEEKSLENTANKKKTSENTMEQHKDDGNDVIEISDRDDDDDLVVDYFHPTASDLSHPQHDL